LKIKDLGRAEIVADLGEDARRVIRIGCIVDIGAGPGDLGCQRVEDLPTAREQGHMIAGTAELAREGRAVTGPGTDDHTDRHTHDVTPIRSPSRPG
jgi:hypothetical protein